MKKYLLLSLSLLFAVTHTCHRRPFHHRDYKTESAVDFINSRYRKIADDMSLFELIEAVVDAMIIFFDTTNNKESFNKHVKRLHDFHPLLNDKLADEDGLRRDYEEYAADYQLEFGKFMSYNEFKKVVYEINGHYNTFCHKLINQTVKRSSWQICNIFYDFKKKLPAKFFARTQRLSGIEVSPYTIWSTVRYRLSIQD